MRNKLTLIIFAIIFFFLCLPSSLTALAANVSVTYLDETGTTQTVTAAEITSSTATLGTGWYVVNADVTRTETITVTGDAKVILMDGKTLTVSAVENSFNPGISVVGGKNLTIFGQAGGTGVLNATGDKWGAGIGSGYYDKSTGTITINGGTVNAYGGAVAAGIGCGYYDTSTSTITINGGTVNAYGGVSNAGIGGGSGENGDTITIHGGHVTAVGESGPGIGSDGTTGANITITGGTIQATGDSGIFTSYNSGGSGGEINITGGIIEATSNGYGAGIGGYEGDGGTITISGGTVVATGGKGGAGIGGSEEGSAGIITISGGTVTAKGGNDDFWGGSPGIGCGNWGEGGTVTLSGGVVFAQAGSDDNYGQFAKDVGGGARSPSHGTLEISNTVALFLKNDRYATPTTTTHTHHTVSGHIANKAAYGISVPWSGNFGAYLRPYTLSYHQNNGSGTVPSQVTQHIGTTVSVVNGGGLSRVGYTFSGWNTAANKEGSGYNEGDTFTFLDDTTLYAVWTPNTYTVKYNANGGTGGSTASSSHTYDEAKPLTPNGFTKTGYTFMGWATSTAGAVTYEDEESVSNLASEYGATVTLYAKWTVNSYTVKYDANGGTGSTAPSSHTYDEAKTLTANGFTRTGYTFSGWATETDGGVVYEDEESVSNLASEDGAVVTLYAAWTPHTYTVSYDANGGTGSTAPSSHTYDEAKALTANGFSRTGYTFAGWATSADGTAVYTDKMSVSNLASENGATVKLYAKWMPHTYTVEYDANRATGSTAPSTHTYDEAKTLTANGFTWTGYTFAGWATDAEGEIVYTNEESVLNLASEDGATVKLYAKWMPHTYTVEYDANGGTGTTASSSHIYDEEKTLTANGFARTGYTFMGWATSSGGEVVYADEESVSNLTSVNGTTVTLYAVWRPHTYTVEYDANGGSGSIDPSSHTYDEAKTLTANSFTRTGYTFAGWANDASGIAIYADGQSVSNLTPEDGVSVTLYAVWRANIYTIDYNANGGSGSTESSSHAYDEARTLTVNGFTKTGYTFMGWATDAAGEVVYADEESVLNLASEDGAALTLYAVWRANAYTVEYDANGGSGRTASSSHTYDEAKTLTANGFTRLGYTFAGWATSARGAALYSDGQSINNHTPADGVTVTLYAVWTPYTYTVSYDANGGSGSTESSSHAYDEARTLTVNGFAKTGYTFTGWATKPDGVVICSDRQSVLNLTSEDGATVTLYAVWTVNSYTVNYSANGGTGTTASSSHTYDEAKTLTANGFKRTGYTFTGWAASSNGATIYNNEESVLNLTAENDETMILYAVWRPHTYTVNYDANGGMGNVASSRHTYGAAKALTANGFTKTGYTFAGWATSPDGTVIYSDGQSVSNLTSMNGETVTLYAVWTPVYSLSVASGTGSGSYKAGTWVSITAEAAPSGKVFDRWASSGGGTFEDASNASTTFTMPDHDVTLTATYKDAHVIPNPVATAPVTLKPLSIQADEQAGIIIVTINIDDLPKGTASIQLPSGEIIQIDMNAGTFELQISQDDLQEDGNLIILALDKENTPLGNYQLDLSDDAWQAGSADSGDDTISVLVWIAVTAAALVIGVLSVAMVRWNKKAKRLPK